jgi:hypothetical protein
MWFMRRSSNCFTSQNKEYENEVFHTEKGTLTETAGEHGVEESIWK